MGSYNDRRSSNPIICWWERQIPNRPHIRAQQVYCDHRVRLSRKLMHESVCGCRSNLVRTRGDPVEVMKFWCWSDSRCGSRITFPLCLMELFYDIFAPRCYASSDCAVTQCLSVCLSVCPSLRPSVTFVDSIEMNKKNLQFFCHRVVMPLYSFPYQTLCQYSDGDPLTGAGGWCKNRDYQPIWLRRVLWTIRPPSAIHSAATDLGELKTLVTGKRRSLLMAGDDDEGYDKKPQR